MQGNSFHNFIDYFKLFKVFDLKKIEKTGLVKLVQDKQLNRKIISVEGNISTTNFITFAAHNHPNITFSERYLYVLGYVDAGKSFCMQIAYSIGNKHFKAVYSTLYKTAKKHQENVVHIPINICPQKWNIAVMDLYELGIHFGLKPQEMKLIFKVTAVQIRASSKVKGLFQADYLYSVNQMPKDIMFPLKKQENFFDKFHYFVVSTDQSLLKDVNNNSQIQQQILESRKQAKTGKDKSKQKERKKSEHNKSIEKVGVKKETDVEEHKKTLRIKQKSKDKQKSIHSQIKKSHPPIANTKNRPTKDQLNIIEHDIDQLQPHQQQLMPPRPQGTISMTLSCVQGFTLNRGRVSTVESYLLKPVYMPTHKVIQTICPCDPNNIRLATAYKDGSMCLWDTLRQQPLSYFMTQLNEIRIVLSDESLNLVLLGLDKMKREVINIISNSSVVFRQISNFNIHGAVLASSTSFEQGIISYGYQNIRIWRVNNQKGIIQGNSIYLGQTNRKVKYTSAIVIKTLQDSLAFVTDSNGFVTTISVTQAKMLQSLKLDSHSLDHIIKLSHQPNDVRALVANQLGMLKIINIQKMELLQELNINSRIKDIQILPNSSDIILTHYNKSIGCINIDSGMYSFLMRSHTAPVNKIIYNPYYNKVISMGKDNSIRIWQYVVEDKGSLPFRLQEQYQFMITGQEMVDAVSPLEGKSEDLKYVVVGGDSGKLRKIDIDSYSIKEEVTLQAGKVNLSMSRNGKFILCTYESGNSYLLDGNLKLIFKYNLSQGDKKKVKNWKNGFNKLSKEYFIQNLQEERLQFFSLKNCSQPVFFISNKQVSSVEAIGDKTFIIGGSELRIYDRQNMIQVFNFNNNEMASLNDPRHHAFSFPILCFAIGEKIVIRVLMANLEEEVQLPQKVMNLAIDYDEQKQQGLIFCSGSQSYSLYVITYQLHNVQFSLSQIPNLTQSNLETDRFEERQSQDLQISFSKTTLSAFTNKPTKQSRKAEFSDQPPKELKKLYAQQEQLYEQVKDYLFPKTSQQLPSRDQDNYYDTSSPQLFNQNQKDGVNVLLQYGYQPRQNARADNKMGNFFWIGQNNSTLMLTGNGKDILQHFFTVPIKHQLVSFPAAISSLTVSLKSYESIRYLAVCVNSLIKIYNVYEELSYIRTIESLSTALPNNIIFDCAITNCNRYLLTLSYPQTNFDSKIHIHLIQITSGNVVSSSYMTIPQPKNKYKSAQIKEAREYQLLINPYKNSLQFILYNAQGILHFYRITSILTLQTMQLEELLPLCRDKINQITSACFIKVGEDNFEDSVIAIGSQNGSIVFVDSRTANILIACVGLVPNTPITSISYSQSYEEEAAKLILFTNSTNLIVYNLYSGINSILNSMETLSSSNVGNQNEVKQVMTLDGEATSHSNIENRNQQLVITKCGSLWLMDYDDLVTVKISSIHTTTINKAQIVSTSLNQACLFTCSDDGCFKVSNLANLEQTLQIYKPRKQAKTFNLEGSFTLISFGQEVFIYNQIQYNHTSNELNSLGSFKLDQTILDIKNIPSTDNYYILTEKELIIVYLVSRQLRNNSQLTIRSISKLSQESTPKQIQVHVQIQKITDVQHPFQLIVNSQFAPYDQFALMTKPGKVSIWSRKCLKRNHNPIDQLAKVHELNYYLIDAIARNSNQNTALKFISQNEYVWGLLEEGLVQIRNFREHAVVKEISFSLSNLTTMICIGNQVFTFIAGDQQGNVYILNQNGLLMERVKALQCSISGLSIFQQDSKKRLVVAGSKYVSIVANINLK